MDLSAEGPIVDMGMLFSALGCDGALVMMDRRADVPISFMPYAAAQPSGVAIHL